MADETLGYGTIIQRGNGASPEVFSEIGHVWEIPEIGPIADELQSTHYTSPGKAREFFKGLRQLEAFTIVFKGTESVFSTLKTDEASDDPINFKLLFPVGSPEFEVSFSALVMSVKINPPLEDRLSISASFRPTGAFTFGA